MAKEFTRFTNLEVTGEMKSAGGFGLTKTTYATDSTKTLPAAAGDSYSKTDFGKVIAALDDIITKYNKLVNQLSTGSDS